jgi:hypothetical protein
MASRVKIFSLPNFATQSPRIALSSDADESQSVIDDVALPGNE